MTSTPKLVPSGSQTVGPFFTIGLEHLVECSATAASPTASQIEIRGRVIDGNGNAVPDAMLEFWGANSSGSYNWPVSNGDGRAPGFRRVGTNESGEFSFLIERPGAVAGEGSQRQAPHLVVLVFARGLMRNLITRVYFPNEPGNTSDLVLAGVPEERRATLIARNGSAPALLHWDVILQGTDETVFFAW